MGDLVFEEPRSQIPVDIALILENWGVAYNPGLPSYVNLSDANAGRHPSAAQTYSAALTNMTHVNIYYWKFMTNRRIRPEAAGLYTHNDVVGLKNYGFPAWYTTGLESDLQFWSDVRDDNDAYKAVYSGTITDDPPFNPTEDPADAFGTSLTYHVQARRGSPAHPSYPAGHDSPAAGITLLKFMHNANLLLKDLEVLKVKAISNGVPVLDERLADPLDLDFTKYGKPANAAAAAGDPIYLEANEDGTKLYVRYNNDATWTVGDELNKAVANITQGRAWVGVHYRADDDAGIILAEEIAIRAFQDILSGWYNPRKIDLGGSTTLVAPEVTVTKYKGGTARNG